MGNQARQLEEHPLEEGGDKGRGLVTTIPDSKFDQYTPAMGMGTPVKEITQESMDESHRTNLWVAMSDVHDGLFMDWWALKPAMFDGIAQGTWMRKHFGHGKASGGKRDTFRYNWNNELVKSFDGDVDGVDDPKIDFKLQCNAVAGNIEKFVRLQATEKDPAYTLARFTNYPWFISFKNAVGAHVFDSMRPVPNDNSGKMYVPGGMPFKDLTGVSMPPDDQLAEIVKDPHKFWFLLGFINKIITSRPSDAPGYPWSQNNDICMELGKRLVGVGVEPTLIMWPMDISNELRLRMSASRDAREEGAIPMADLLDGNMNSGKSATLVLQGLE